MSNGDCNIRVIGRFRPENAREKKETANIEKQQIFSFSKDSICEVRIPGQSQQTFTLDYILPESSTQKDIYEVVGKRTIEEVLEGFNGTIFAYGQTGSGKTHTMFGPEGYVEPDSPDRGIIPRATRHIFESIDNDKSETHYAIKCSYLEIYNEKIMDLLDTTKTNLAIHETPSRGVWVQGLTEEYVTCEQDIMDLLVLGSKNRAVSATEMNKTSSRSHSVFIIVVEQKNAEGAMKTGKLNLVDLAGSEKVKKTEATGQTLEEAKKINQSLSSLGNCIHSLTESKRAHVPYRDSKLTHILKESLGGNTKTTLVITCSPSIFNVEETISTLKFGTRVKTIKNSVKVNKTLSVAELQALVSSLTKQLNDLKTYSTSLEEELKWIKNPNYDPSKPFEGKVTKKEPASLDASQEDTPDLSDSSSSISSISSEPGPGGFNPLALASAQAQLQKLKEATSIKIQDLETELESIKEKEAAAQKELEERAEKLKESNTQLVGAKRELDGSKEQWTIAKNKYEFDLQQQQLELESLTVEVSEKRVHVSELDSRLTKTKEELVERESNIQTLEQKLREIESRVGNTNIDLIKQENSELQQYILQLENEMSGIREQQVDVTIKDKELETMRSALEETRIRASQFETQLITAKAELSELEARAESDVSTVIEELNAASEREKALQTKLDEIENSNKAAQTTVAVANEGKDLWERKYNLLKEENDILKSNGAMVPNELAEAIARANAQLEQASNQQIATVLELQGKISALQLEMNKQKVEHDTIQKQLTKTLTSSVKNEAKASANASHVQTVQGELENTKRENLTLKAEIEQLKSIVKQSESEKVQLVIQMKKGNHTTLMTAAEKNSFESRIEELKTKVRNSQADIRTVKDKLTATEHALSVETSKATTMAKKLDQQTGRLKDLDQRVLELQKHGLLAESIKNQAEDSLAQLTAELSELQKHAKRLEDENERLRLRPSNKIYRTTRFGGNDALKDKIDFSKIELRKTSSKYLADARNESVLLEVENRERTSSLTRPATPTNLSGTTKGRFLPLPNFEIN